MKKIVTLLVLVFKMWILSSLVLTCGLSIVFFAQVAQAILPAVGAIFIGSLVGGVPAWLAVCFTMFFMDLSALNWQQKIRRLVAVQVLISFCYGLFAAILNIPINLFGNSSGSFLLKLFFVAAILLGCALIAVIILLTPVASFFSGGSISGSSYSNLFLSILYKSNKNFTIMETNDEQQGYVISPRETQSNRLLVKGIITGVLILLMLIPTIFINNIITEREQRQKEVVKEVSSKWASAQTITGPYLVVPYADTSTTAEGKTVVIKKQLILLANELNASGKIFPEQRPRSIYKVLLYKSDISLSGTFKPQWPADINTGNIDFDKSRLCFGISDFKGIEEEIKIDFNNSHLNFAPGLPTTQLNDIGLTVPVSLSAAALDNGIKFSMNVKLKGSEQLHFIPLAANSKFELSSGWPNPSFDGNTLPGERSVSDSGFTAKWNFNQANLPFGTVLKAGPNNVSDLAFGVSMVQPADQYNKTMRSVKYAILFIGLTFGLFFLIEIMQRKPFHPVQYVLVGLALVIFYTLLLSISEYLLFDQAYLIAAAATVILITLYAKSHFSQWKTAAIFFTTLSLLYSFIFVLIRLEDTALLIGSVGLFAVLALVMFVSRKVKWYGDE